VTSNLPFRFAGVRRLQRPLSGLPRDSFDPEGPRADGARPSIGTILLLTHVFNVTGLVRRLPVTGSNRRTRRRRTRRRR